MKLSNRVLKMEESVTLAAAARAKALKAEGRDILSLKDGRKRDFGNSSAC